MGKGISKKRVNDEGEKDRHTPDIVHERFIRKREEFCEEKNRCDGDQPFRGEESKKEGGFPFKLTIDQTS